LKTEKVNCPKCRANFEKPIKTSWCCPRCGAKWLEVQGNKKPKKWHETWWGALWVLSFSQLPGGIKRFQEWDKHIKEAEKNERTKVQPDSKRGSTAT
jgi:hypothetical protein